ncbi:putative endoribonuclease l-psp [Diaporthe ampelina]|uniref:Putative endoribonuclease l-psp n=1 Tax=Diaporthe ampelina TaxID=1214573 RepID=A0A0G2H700_9PEZI|nr:putative endoribonuclease l-psp [Diaporthe ampelina]
MSKIESVLTDKAPKPLPQFSQAIKYNGLVYCSGNIGLDPATFVAVEGTVKDRTRQALKNLEAVLEASGSSKRNVLKVNIFITTMDDFATMNEAYDEFFSFEPKPQISGVPHGLDLFDLRSPAQATSPTAANPPASTRPPPLSLPARDPAASTFSHLFATGKAYLTFYKTGFKQIYTNTRLVWSLGSASGIPPDTPAPAGQPAEPPTLRPAATTRSTELLKRRWLHDVRRLPLFALMFVICGEFTPLVVLALPGVVPLTCRIPRQTEKLRRATEARRRASSARIQGKTHRTGASGGPVPSRAEVTAHVARSLNLISPLWDRLPLPDGLVSLLASRRVRAHVAYLDRDGHLLSQAGGVPALEDDEVALACEDRGLPVVDRSAAALRESLGRWAALASGPDGVGGNAGGPWSPAAVARRETLVVSLLAAQKWPLERQELEALASKIEW